MVEKAFPLKIGLEIHGYLDTKEKLFCMCKTDFLNSKNNSLVCPICTGQPGSKPMLPNESAMDKLLEIALIMGCKINHDKDLIWQRKHYNWADLPKGYQNTISGAYSIPVAVNGKFEGIRITECHLEEDPAQWNPETGGINYNRSGLPLVEIVTEPDFHSSEQVVNWLRVVVHSLSYIKAFRKNGGIKVDVNVSTYGERVEMKNLNSIEKIRKAIDYEIIRQLENYEKGIVQERDTLAFDEKSGKTIKMRSKEGAADYRFIPDPDLPVIRLDKKKIEKMGRELPEMPSAKLDKLLKKYKLEKSDAETLIKNLELVDFVEALAEGTEVSGNVVIVHGSNENEKEAKRGGVENTRHWHSWIRKELQKKNIEVSGELYPKDWNPDFDEWKNVFEKNKIDEKTILVGHSAGCAFILRWLMQTKKKVSKLIFVAPYLKDDGIATWLKEFVTFDFDDSLKSFYNGLTVFYDKKDLKGILESVELIKKKLPCKLIELKNHGHFTKGDMGTEEFPELLEELSEKGIDVKKNISWITIELLRVLNYNKKTLEEGDVEIKPEHLAELISLVDKGELTVLKAKQIMNDFVPKSFSVKEKLSSAIGKLSDEETKKLVEQVIKENPKVWEEFKSGKKESLNFLIGCVMKLSNRRADFGKVREVMEGIGR